MRKTPLSVADYLRTAPQLGTYIDFKNKENTVNVLLLLITCKFTKLIAHGSEKHEMHKHSIPVSFISFINVDKNYRLT